MAQLNYHNFFRWHTNQVADDTINLPRLSVRQNKSYLPIVAIGEAFSFYMNLEVPFNDEEFANLRLDLVKSNGTVVAGVGVLSQDVISGTNYNLFSELTLNVAAGIYQLRIYNTVSDTLKCISNYFQVLPLETADLITVAVRYRNSRNHYKFRYVENAAFYNKVRLHLGLKDWQPEGNFQQYRSVSTGKLRNEKYELDRLVKLETYYFDDAAHDSMAILCSCDNIELNTRLYLAKGLYKPTINENSTVSKGEVDLYDYAFSKINKYG